MTEIPRRPLGRTGVDVSILCLGGAHIGGKPSEAEGIRLIHQAIEAGIDFLDNAWEYNNRRERDAGWGRRSRRRATGSGRS